MINTEFRAWIISAFFFENNVTPLNLHILVRSATVNFASIPASARSWIYSSVNASLPKASARSRFKYALDSKI